MYNNKNKILKVSGTLFRSDSTLALKSKTSCYKLNLCEVNLVKTFIELEKVSTCQQAWQVVPVKSTISYFQTPLRPIGCCPLLLIN